LTEFAPPRQLNRYALLLRLSGVKTLRRITVSFAGGILLPLGLFWLLAFVTEYLHDGNVNYRLGKFLFVLIFWPQYIWEPIFPRVPPCSSCGPSDAALFGTAITIFLFWFAITYVLQIVLERRRSKRARRLIERNA
jgi:hypothetical protein